MNKLRLLLWALLAVVCSAFLLSSDTSLRFAVFTAVWCISGVISFVILLGRFKLVEVSHGRLRWEADYERIRVAGWREYRLRLISLLLCLLMGSILLSVVIYEPEKFDGRKFNQP